MVRLVFAAWRLQFKLFSRSPFFVSLALFTPIAYVTIALLMAGNGNASEATHVLFGAGLLGTWSTTLFGAGESLYMQRFTGTLTMLLSSPRTLFAPVVGFSLASVTLGLYSIAAVWFWGVVVFHVKIGNADIFGLIVGLLVSLFSLVSLGIVLAAYYILSRQAMAISNLLEYPIWIVTGLLFPVSYLWEWMAWFGKILPLGWAVDVVSRAIANRPYGFELSVAILLSLLFALLGYLLLKRVDYKVRVSGELVLR